MVLLICSVGVGGGASLGKLRRMQYKCCTGLSYTVYWVFRARTVTTKQVKIISVILWRVVELSNSAPSAGLSDCRLLNF